MDLTEAKAFIDEYYSRISAPGHGSNDVSNEQNIDWRWLDDFVAEFYVLHVSQLIGWRLIPDGWVAHP